MLKEGTLSTSLGEESQCGCVKIRQMLPEIRKAVFSEQ